MLLTSVVVEPPRIAIRVGTRLKLRACWSCFSRFGERWFNSLCQEKQLQHALNFSGRGTAENCDPRWHEIEVKSMLELFLPIRRTLVQFLVPGETAPACS